MNPDCIFWSPVISDSEEYFDMLSKEFMEEING